MCPPSRRRMVRNACRGPSAAVTVGHHRLSPTVRNTALARQQGERYDPVGTLAARIVTTEQASSAGCYDPSATLLALPSSGCCYVPSATSPAESARALRNALAGAATGGRGVRGEALPPACWPSGSPEGSWSRRGAMPGGQGRMSGTPPPHSSPRRSHSPLTARPVPALPATVGGR